MKKYKLGIFYNKIESPKYRKYWIGTWTKDNSTCQTIYCTIEGQGAAALRKAKILMQ